MPIDGTEQVILGDLSDLAEGGPVVIAPATGETKVASFAGTPATTHSSNSGRPTNTPPASGPIELLNGPVRKTEGKF